MVKIALQPLCNLAGPADGARGYGYDKARYFSKLSQFDAKRPSSRRDGPYIIGASIELAAEGGGHDFRKVANGCRLVMTAAFGRVAKIKLGAFDPRKFVSLAKGCCVGHRRLAQCEVPARASEVPFTMAI